MVLSSLIQHRLPVYQRVKCHCIASANTRLHRRLYNAHNHNPPFQAQVLAEYDSYSQPSDDMGSNTVIQQSCYAARVADFLSQMLAVLMGLHIPLQKIKTANRCNFPKVMRGRMLERTGRRTSQFVNEPI
jgi:ABC-type cobalamin transport system ATPase subunit